MLLHASFDVVNSFYPRVPSEQTRMRGENDTIPRVCVCPTIAQCITAMPLAGETASKMHKLGMPVILHVYELASDNILSNQAVQKYVPDAFETSEMWILDAPKIHSRTDYILDIQFKEVFERGELYHTIQRFKYTKVQYQDNVENLLNILDIEEKREEWENLMRKHPFQSLLKSMYNSFLIVKGQNDDICGKQLK